MYNMHLVLLVGHSRKISTASRSNLQHTCGVLLYRQILHKGCARPVTGMTLDNSTCEGNTCVKYCSTDGCNENSDDVFNAKGIVIRLHLQQTVIYM